MLVARSRLMNVVPTKLLLMMLKSVPNQRTNDAPHFRGRFHFCTSSIFSENQRNPHPVQTRPHYHKSGIFARKAAAAIHRIYYSNDADLSKTASLFAFSIGWQNDIKKRIWEMTSIPLLLTCPADTAAPVILFSSCEPYRVEDLMSRSSKPFLGW